MLQKTWAGCDGRAWGGGWEPVPAWTQTCWSARMGVLVVISARGKGVNVAVPPLPPVGSRAARPKRA